MNLPLLRSSLLKIYKLFVRQHLNHGDVIYDQPNNFSLLDKLEGVQYNAVVAITGTIRRTSNQKLYLELVLESSRIRRWLRRMPYLYKIISTKSPPYLHVLIHPPQRSYRYLGYLKTFRYRLDFPVTCFYRLLSMNGINWTLILRTVILMQFYAKVFCFYKTCRK